MMSIASLFDHVKVLWLYLSGEEEVKSEEVVSANVSLPVLCMVEVSGSTAMVKLETSLPFWL